MGMFILALLGIGAAAFAIDELFDDDADTSVDGDGEAPDDEGPELETVTIDENGLLIGTSGADVITNEETDLAEIRAGGGDDQISVTGDGVDIFGEAGDDIINIDNGLGNIISGGLGNDTISASEGSTEIIRGDEGDDDITFTSAFNGSDVGATDAFQVSQEVSRIDGGAGDDRFTINAASDEFFPGPDVTGGEGQDIFEIDLTTTDFNFTVNQSDEELFFEFDQNGEVVGEIETPVIPAGTFTTITDFNPSEDQLVLDVRDTHDQTSGAHVFDRAEVNENNGGTTISLFFESARPDDPDSTYLLETRLSLPGVQGLSLGNDLVIVTS